MGRPGKSLEQHLKDGTFRADRHGHLRPADGAAEGPSAKPPECPPDLTGEERVKWKDLLAVLGARATKADVALLAELCRWATRADKLAAALGGMAVTDPLYAKTLVAAGITCDKLLAMSARFGLSPGDRGKMKLLTTTAGIVATKTRVAVRPRTAMDRLGPPPTALDRMGPPTPEED